MMTDDERRRLAENLRGGYDVTRSANVLFWLNGTLFGMDICARSEEKIRDGLRHLAAFIEPEPERTCRNVDRSGGFTCSECGVRAHVLVIDEDMCDWTKPPHPDYCPGCGAKVVEDGHR